MSLSSAVFLPAKIVKMALFSRRISIGLQVYYHLIQTSNKFFVMLNPTHPPTPHPPPPPPPPLLQVFMCLGMTGMFGSQVRERTRGNSALILSTNQLLYIFGVAWAGPDRASAFQPAIPVWTTILALLSCTEKLPSPFHVSPLYRSSCPWWAIKTGIICAGLGKGLFQNQLIFLL